MSISIVICGAMLTAAWIQIPPAFRIRDAEVSLPPRPSEISTFSPCTEKSREATVQDRLLAVVECYVEKGRFAGTILVARGQRILLAEGFGLANREWGIPNDVDTRFRLGSLSKAFTGVLVMRMVQEGQLRLSDPIGRHIPDLPERVAAHVTVRHLLTHTSGLPEFFRVPEFQRLWMYEPPSTLDLIKAVAVQPLEFTPGERYEYRNIGFITLGYIIEQVTGLVYERALKSYVLEPARMDDSGVEQAGEIVANMATGYSDSDQGWREGSFLNPDIGPAAGFVYSTAMDLFRFSRALDTNALLDPETQAAMFTPRVKEQQDPDDQRYYGYGWHLDRLELGEGSAPVEIIEHGGDVTSFETLFTRVPELDALVVILYNHGETDQDAIRDDLIRVLAQASRVDLE